MKWYRLDQTSHGLCRSLCYGREDQIARFVVIESIAVGHFVIGRDGPHITIRAEELPAWCASARVDVPTEADLTWVCGGSPATMTA